MLDDISKHLGMDVEALALTHNIDIPVQGLFSDTDTFRIIVGNIASRKNISDVVMFGNVNEEYHSLCTAVYSLGSGFLKTSYEASDIATFLSAFSEAQKNELASPAKEIIEQGRAYSSYILFSESKDNRYVSRTKNGIFIKPPAIITENPAEPVGQLIDYFKVDINEVKDQRRYFGEKRKAFRA